jgi:hypothetical protein
VCVCVVCDRIVEDKFFRPCFAQHAAVGPATIECWLKVHVRSHTVMCHGYSRSDTDTPKMLGKIASHKSTTIQHIRGFAQETSSCWNLNKFAAFEAKQRNNSSFAREWTTFPSGNLWKTRKHHKEAKDI